jgi:hypothetical protein
VSSKGCDCGKSHSEPPAEGEIRCQCGCLLARRVERVVELKCRRCKRTRHITVAADESP